MINSTVTADHWSIPFRPPHFITFSARSRKRIGFSASGRRMKKSIEERTGWRASFDRSSCVSAGRLPCFLSHRLVEIGPDILGAWRAELLPKFQS
jgi:hypothetical protein